jgi:O-phosphoseryl-tRNA(Cys) synthetase
MFSMWPCKLKIDEKKSKYDNSIQTNVLAHHSCIVG